MYLVIQTLTTHGLNLIKMLNKSHVIILCVYIYFTDNTETKVDYYKEYIPSYVLEVFLKLAPAAMYSHYVSGSRILVRRTSSS